VVASARTIKPSPDPSLLTVAADITESGTPGQIVDAASFVGESFADRQRRA
jgi:hypothetical protein